jgi:4-hydroxybenzoate polyprenyltransferase
MVNSRMGNLEKWDAALIAVIGAFSLQVLKTINPVLFWIIFGILLWIAIYKLMRRYG